MLTALGISIGVALLAAVAYLALCPEEGADEPAFCVSGPTDHTPRWPRRATCQVPDFVPEEWS